MLPSQPIGAVVIAMAILSLSQTAVLVRLWPHWQREHRVGRGLTMVVLGGGLYAYELALGVQLVHTPPDLGALSRLLDVLLGTYALGLARAWELLGAEHGRGLVSQVEEVLAARRAAAGAPEEGPASAAESSEHPTPPGAQG
jgi:hypothetical protein